MGLYTGVSGYIKKGASTADTPIVHMSSWDVEVSREMIERTSFGNDYKEKFPGIKDWNAKADGAADFKDGTSQKELFDAFEDGTLLAFGFGLDANTYLDGSGYIESISVTNNADGSADISISVQGSEGILLTLPGSTT